jgi:hypothetical protein
VTIKPEDIHSPFTLEIDSNHIEPEVFLKATRAFCNLLETLAREVTDKPVKWNLSVQKGSAGVAIAPERNQLKPVERAKVVRLYETGLNRIQKKQDFPEDYPLEAIKSFHAISEATKSVPVGLWRSKNKTKLNEDSLKHLSSLLEKYEDYGAISGILLGIDGTRGKKITVVDRITGQRIKCVVEDQLLHEALRLFGQRVDVYGDVKYSSQGVAMSIKAKEIVPIVQVGERIKLSELKGILKVQDE